MLARAHHHLHSRNSTEGNATHVAAPATWELLPARKPVASCLEENKGSEYLGSTLYSHLIPCRDPLTFPASSSSPYSQPLRPLHSNLTSLLMPPPLDHEMAFDDDGA